MLLGLLCGVQADGSPYCTLANTHTHTCTHTYSMTVWVLFWIFMHQRSAEERRHDMSCRSRNIGHSHSSPVSSLSGLFKSSLCFCSVMCAYHCSDFSLAGGRTFQGNGWPRITHTHTHTHTHRRRMTEGVRSSTLSLPKRSLKLLLPNRHMTFQAEKLPHTHTHTHTLYSTRCCDSGAHDHHLKTSWQRLAPPATLCLHCHVLEPYKLLFSPHRH